MKIYNRVVIDNNGRILEEDSFEYQGIVAYCKGGSDRGARRQAEQSYQLQLEMFEFRKEQAAKLLAGKESEEARAAAKKQRQLQIKRSGRRSTILTGPTGLSGLPEVKRGTLLGGAERRIQ